MAVIFIFIFSPHNRNLKSIRSLIKKKKWQIVALQSESRLYVGRVLKHVTIVESLSAISFGYLSSLNIMLNIGVHNFVIQNFERISCGQQSTSLVGNYPKRLLNKEMKHLQSLWNLSSTIFYLKNQIW